MDSPISRIDEGVMRAVGRLSDALDRADSEEERSRGIPFASMLATLHMGLGLAITCIGGSMALYGDSRLLPLVFITIPLGLLGIQLAMRNRNIAGSILPSVIENGWGRGDRLREIGRPGRRVAKTLLGAFGLVAGAFSMLKPFLDGSERDAMATLVIMIGLHALFSAMFDAQATNVLRRLNREDPRRDGMPGGATAGQGI